jgi:hypothetical protein
LPSGYLIASVGQESLLKDLATMNLTPLVITDLEGTLKVSDDVSLLEEILTYKTIVDSVGLWNILDDEVFKEHWIRS